MLTSTCFNYVTRNVLMIVLILYHAWLLEISGMKVKSRITFKLFHLDPIFEEQQWATVLHLMNTT
jgi:hypothetical protein